MLLSDIYSQNIDTDLNSAMFNNKLKHVNVITFDPSNWNDEKDDKNVIKDATNDKKSISGENYNYNYNYDY